MRAVVDEVTSPRFIKKGPGLVTSSTTRIGKRSNRAGFWARRLSEEQDDVKHCQDQLDGGERDGGFHEADER